MNSIRLVPLSGMNNNISKIKWMKKTTINNLIMLIIVIKIGNAYALDLNNILDIQTKLDSQIKYLKSFIKITLNASKIYIQLLLFIWLNEWLCLK